ncbi:MAG TPA: TonB C-terminal domain-containing protein [Sphingomonadaceae bacterium]|nr:TonB C-terminal domain-containing protein [Sphingomonadaceae bacterium]
MQIAHLRKEEQFGLAIAAAAHLALLGALAFNASRQPAQVPVPERMVVSLADEVSLTSTSPNPSLDSNAAVAPTLAPSFAPPPEPEPVVQPKPEPKKPEPRKPEPRPAPKPVPKAAQVPQPKPAPKPSPAAKPAAKPQPKPKPAGGSRLGDNFLAGTSTGERSDARGAPAAAFGPAEQASLASAISRQLRPYWNAPQGVDVEKLVTIVRFRLNPDGTLNGEPRVVSQSGETASNASQKGRHAELAIRAVKLAAPFELPPEFYQQWKTLNATFDRNLSR